jgi:hypothetical protein
MRSALSLLSSLVLGACSGNALPLGNSAKPDGDTIASPLGAGFIEIEESANGTNFFVFFNADSKGADSLTMAPSCTVTSPGGFAGVGGALSAGQLTFDSELSVVLNPDSHQTYAAGSSIGEQFFIPGGSIQVTASGGEVPPFNASLVGPRTVVMHAPFDGSSSAAEIDRGKDLSLSWSPVPATTVRVILSETAAIAGRDSVLSCEFDGGLGHATLPSSELSRFDPGKADLMAKAFAGASVSSGGFQTRIRASADAVQPNGAGYRYTFTLK